MIQTALPEHLTKIARCHQQAFPHSVTSLFGVPFIRKMFEWYLSAPNKFLFWIEEEGECIGYCGGLVMDGSDAYGSASGMTQFGFGAAVKIMLRKPWLFFHPEIRARYPFIVTNTKRKIKKIFGHQETPQPIVKHEKSTAELTAGLVVIGVNPSYHGKGIGSQLQQEFERRANQLGAVTMRLSVRTENAKAISSYQRNGWSIIKDEKISFLMEKRIS
jgi:ribosomal protein S18 acetylase RimI-like enzyme